MRRNPNLRFTDFEGAARIQAPEIGDEPNFPWAFSDLSGNLVPASAVNPNLSAFDRVKILGMTAKLSFEGTVENENVPTELEADYKNQSMHNILGPSQAPLRRIIQIPHRKLLRLYWVMYRGPPLPNGAADYVNLFEDRYGPPWRSSKTNDEDGNAWDGSGRGNWHFRRQKYVMRVIKKMVIREPAEPTQFGAYASVMETAEHQFIGTAPTVTEDAHVSTSVRTNWHATRYHPAKRFKVKLPNVFRTWYRNTAGLSTVVEDPPVFFLLALFPSWLDRWGNSYVDNDVGVPSCPMMRFNYDSRVFWTVYRGEA